MEIAAGLSAHAFSGNSFSAAERNSRNILRDHADYYVSCADPVAALGMRAYAAGLDGDPALVSGESGAATFGAAVCILTDACLADARSAMKLSSDSVLLFISTEGDTDPDNYRKIVGCAKETNIM